MKHFHRLCLTLVCLLPLAATTARAQQLVTDGTFSTPSTATTTVAPGGPYPTGWGWTVSGGSIAFGTNYGSGSGSDTQGVLLAPPNKPALHGAINQTILTAAGQTYIISLDIEDKYSYGASGTFSFGSSTFVLSATSGSYQTYTTTETASSSSTVLSITGNTLNTADSLIVSNVSVTVDTNPVVGSQWVGGMGGKPTDWGTAANWNPSGVPSGTGVAVSFGSQAGANNIVDLGSSSRTVGSIEFFNTTGTTIQSSGGNSLVFDNGGGLAPIGVTGQHAITAGISLNSSLAMSMTGASSQLTFGGSVSNGTASGGISLAGTGTLVLGGSNSYSGATTVSGGTLNLENSLALQNSTLNANGGGIAFNAAVASHAFTLGGLSGTANFALSDSAGNPVALTVGHNNSFSTFQGNMSGSGSLTKIGSGTLTLSSDQSYTGNTFINGGTLQVGDNATLQNSLLGSNAAGVLDSPANDTSPSVLGLTGTGALTLSPAISGLSLNRPSGATQAYSGNLTALNPNFALTMNGPGMQTLSGSNTYGGSTYVNGGTLNLNGTHMSTNTLYVAPGGVVNVNGTETINGATSNAQLWVDWNGFSGGTATMNVSGALNLTTASGNSNLVGQEFGTGVLNILPGGVVNVTNDDLRIGNTSSNAPTGVLTMFPGSLLTLDDQSSNTAFIFGNGGNSTGATGILNLNGGTIQTGRNVNGGIGTAIMNFNGGLLVATISSSAFVNIGSNPNSVINIRNGGLIVNTNGNFDTITSPLLHSNVPGDNAIDGGLTLIDRTGSQGSLTLTASNTYTGPTTVLGGTLALGAGGSINSSGTIALANGATLDVTAQGGNFHLLAGQTLTGNGNFNMAGALTANGGSFILPGGIASAGTLSIGGLTLSTGSVLNYDFGNGQDLIKVTYGGGLIVNGGAIGLYQANGTTPFSTPGTYTLMTFVGGLGGEASNLSVLNPVGGDSYTFATNGGALTLTIGGGNFWTGGGSPSVVWSNTANWSTSQVPVSGQSVVFAGSLGLTNTNNLTNLDVAGLTFTSSAGAFHITGNSIQLGGAITSASAATQTIGLNMELVDGSQTIDALAGKIVISGQISDGGQRYGIIKDGTGTLILSGSNTYSGGTFVDAGTLILESATALADGASLTVGQGASSIFAPASGGPSIAPAGSSVEPVAVPEPGSMVLLVAALWSAAIYCCFRRPMG
jgi:fibronectin-binding autotransporter adhesin